MKRRVVSQVRRNLSKKFRDVSYEILVIIEKMEQDCVGPLFVLFSQIGVH